jgi:hypothetical protein
MYYDTNQKQVMKSIKRLIRRSILAAVAFAGVGLAPRHMKTLALLIAATGAAPLAAQQRPDIVWCKGGQASLIRSVAFSPDGQLLASGGAVRIPCI